MTVSPADQRRIQASLMEKDTRAKIQGCFSDRGENGCLSIFRPHSSGGFSLDWKVPEVDKLKGMREALENYMFMDLVSRESYHHPFFVELTSTASGSGKPIANLRRSSCKIPRLLYHEMSDMSPGSLYRVVVHDWRTDDSDVTLYKVGTWAARSSAADEEDLIDFGQTVPLAGTESEASEETVTPLFKHSAFHKDFLTRYGAVRDNMYLGGIVCIFDQNIAKYEHKVSHNISFRKPRDLIERFKAITDGPSEYKDDIEEGGGPSASTFSTKSWTPPDYLSG